MLVDGNMSYFIKGAHINGIDAHLYHMPEVSVMLFKKFTILINLSLSKIHYKTTGIHFPFFFNSV